MVTEKIAIKNRNDQEKSLSLSLKRVYERFFKIRGTPRNIALGFALGLFIGITPSIGFQTAIVIFLAALLKWNKISSAIGVWITNPITAPFIYGVTYFTGAKLLGIRKTYEPAEEMSLNTFSKLMHKAPDIIWALILGGIVIGIPLAVVGYYLAYSALSRYQEGISRKIAAQRERLSRRKRRAKKKIKKKKRTRRGY